MSLRRYRPRRRLRSELLLILLAVGMPLVMAWIFPYGALAPLSQDGFLSRGPTAASCAFVELDETEESNAIIAARTAWHVNSSGVKSLRIEVFADDLPEDDTGPVIDFQDRIKIMHDKAIVYEPIVMPTDLRASPPAILAKPETSCKRPPFAREEMLKLD